MITNTTSKRVVARSERYYTTPWQHARGLMFSPKRTLVFVFPSLRRISLHMFFVFFSIDIIFLDAAKRVVEVKEAFKPFTFHNSKKQAKYLIEAPAGVIKRARLKVGDRLRFSPI